MKYVEVSVHEQFVNDELFVNLLAALRAAKLLVQVCTSSIYSYQGWKGGGGQFDSSSNPPDWGEKVRGERGRESAPYHARKGDGLMLVGMADRYGIGAAGGATPILQFEDPAGALEHIAEIISAINGS